MILKYEQWHYCCHDLVIVIVTGSYYDGVTLCDTLGSRCRFGGSPILFTVQQYDIIHYTGHTDIAI